MNGFWNMIGESEKRGKYETNFFHMYIYEDIGNNEVYELDSGIKGTFMHEYLHYLQFISTLFGISYGIMSNKYYKYCIKYFEEHQNIEIPLNIKSLYPEMDKSKESYNALKGSNKIAINIDKIEVNENNILEAEKKKTGVDVLGINTKTKETELFTFGYLCIIESMADIFQSFFDSKTEHSEIPYKSVHIICKNYLPDFADDRKLLFSICLCALMHKNPACGFFKVLEIVRQNPEMDGTMLYKHILEESDLRHISCKTLKELSLKFITNYQLKIETAIGSNLDYFSMVFENCILEINSGESILLKLLYETDINSQESMKLLLDFYGLPFIEGRDIALLGNTANDKKTQYNDIALLYGLEMVINRVIPSINAGEYPIYDTKCPMYDKCNKSLYINEPSSNKMTKDCENKQWEKNEICLMTQALKRYKLYNKNIIQKSLPEDMQ